MWEEGHTSVSAGVYCTDLGAFRVSDCNFSMALEALCLLCSDRVLGILLFSLDVLNFYWFYSMIHTYVKYYPKDMQNENNLNMMYFVELGIVLCNFE